MIPLFINAHYPPRPLSGPSPLLPERRRLGLTSGHQLCKTFLRFPPLFAFYGHFECVPPVLCFHCNNKPANITNIRPESVYWVGEGGKKERKRRKKKNPAVNVALEPREPTALPRALSPPAPSLSVSAASRQLGFGFFFLPFSSLVSFQTECTSLSAICLFFLLIGRNTEGSQPCRR